MPGNHGLALASLNFTMIVLCNEDMLAVMSSSLTHIRNTVETLFNGYEYLSEIPVRDNSRPSVDIMVSVGSEVFKDRAINLSAFLLVKRNSLLNCKYFEQACCMNLGHVSSCFFREIGTFVSDFTLSHLGNFHR